MTAEDLRAIMDELRRRVRLDSQEDERPVVVVFAPPTVDEAAACGLNPASFRQIIDAPWWSEMIEEIAETPEFCDPDDPPERVLEFARDVVSDYLRKRVQL